MVNLGTQTIVLKNAKKFMELENAKYITVLLTENAVEINLTPLDAAFVAHKKYEKMINQYNQQFKVYLYLLFEWWVSWNDFYLQTTQTTNIIFSICNKCLNYKKLLMYQALRDIIIMELYPPTEKEQQYRKSSYDIDVLKLLNENGQIKVQYSFHNRAYWLESINDAYQQFRIVTIAVLIKLYSNNSSENQQRLNHLKSIIYEGKLYSLTHSKKLQRDQLFKTVAIHLNTIQLKKQQSLQLQIINLFNKIAFFDQVIMSSITQQIQLGTKAQNLQRISKWLKKILNLTIIWTDEDIVNEPSNQLYLKKRDNLILRRSMKIPNPQEILNQSQDSSSIYYSIRSRKPKPQQRTISIESRPSSNCNKQNSPFNASQVETAAFNERLTDHKQKRASNLKLNKKSNNGFFWNLFCCSFD